MPLQCDRFVVLFCFVYSLRLPKSNVAAKGTPMSHVSVTWTVAAISHDVVSMCILIQFVVMQIFLNISVPFSPANSGIQWVDGGRLVGRRWSAPVDSCSGGRERVVPHDCVKHQKPKFSELDFPGVEIVGAPWESICTLPRASQLPYAKSKNMF